MRQPALYWSLWRGEPTGKFRFLLAAGLCACLMKSTGVAFGVCVWEVERRASQMQMFPSRPALAKIAGMRQNMSESNSIEYQNGNSENI